MNWNAIGAIAELLGAIGVIASLVYLARQIQDGRRAVRASTYQQFRQDTSNTLNVALTTPGLIEIVKAGLADNEGLSDEEAFQFGFWLTGVMSSYDNALYQYRMGILDEDRWLMHRGDISRFFYSPGVRQWWSGVSAETRAARVGSGRERFSAHFTALVEEILTEQRRAE